MTKPRFSYDEQCFELAEYFLPSGTQEERSKLAQTIQDAIEDWLQERERAARG